MTVQVFCVKCDRSCRVPPEHVGKRVRCPGCQEIFKAEQPPLAQIDEADAVQVFCPKCDSAGRVSPGLVGRRVRCASCHDVFMAEDVPVAALDEDAAGVADEHGKKSSAADTAKSTADSTLRQTPPPPPRVEKARPLVEKLPDDRADSKKTSLASRGDRERDEDDDEDDRDERSAERRDHRDRSRRDDDEPRDKKRPAKDEDDSKKKGVSRFLENPFVGSSTLAPVEVDQSVFEFEWGDEQRPQRDDDRDRSAKKKSSDGRDRDDERRDSKKKEEDRPAARSKKDKPDTEYAWDEKKSPPDQLPSESGATSAKKKTAAVEQPEADHSSPFAFGSEPPSRPERKGRSDEDDARKPDSRRDRGKDERRDEERDERKALPAKKPASRAAVDDAAFLGLANLEPPPPDEEKAGEKKSSGKRAFFHLRQIGHWDEPKLFRVFVEKVDLSFVVAASGDAIANMEAALQADSLKEFDKRIRNRVLDLDELPIDELLDKDDDNFVWSAQKITDAAIDPPSAKARRQSAILQLVHKSKGSLSFELPSDADADSALDLLRDLLADVLQVHVRWDKASKRFVKR